MPVGQADIQALLYSFKEEEQDVQVVLEPEQVLQELLQSKQTMPDK